MADEKKIALVIQLRADGQGKAQEVTVNLKNLGAAHEDTAKKAEKSGMSLEKLIKKVAGFLVIREAVKIVKGLGQALVGLVEQAVAFQSEFSPLRQGFEQSASKIKTAFATITSAALPAIVGLMTAMGDALGAIGDFVDKNRELIATNVVKWAVDSGRALVSGFAAAATLANKSLHGLEDGFNVAKGFALSLAADIGESKGPDSVFAPRARELRRASDEAFAAAIKGQAEMKEFDKTLDGLVTKAGGYLDKVEKVGLAAAKKPVRMIDPDQVAKSQAVADASIAIIIDRLGKLSTIEQAMSDVSFARYKLHEELKASTTAERTRQVEERLRSLDALEESLQNKYQAKYIADLGAKAQADADYYAKLRALQQSQAEYQADLAARKSADTERREPPKSLLSTAVAAQKVKSFVGPKTEDQVAKDESILQEHADNIMDMAAQIGAGIGGVMAESIAAIASGTKTALEGLGGMLGGIIAMIGKMLIEMGTAALVVAAISAIAGNPGAGATAAAGAAAIVAGGAMLAAGTALNSAIGAAEGGLVVGGVMGRDSVRAYLEPGEYVIPAAQVRQNVAAGRAPDDSGASGARGGGGNISLTVNQSSFVPGTKADFNRSVREAVLPAIRQLARQGLLVLK